MKAALRIAATMALALAAATAALAQGLQTLDSDADRELRECLRPTREALPPLPYPSDELLLKRDATVRVRMNFTRPDAAPEASVFFNSGGSGFADAVLERVKSYRVPCLPAERKQPLVLTQEFYFDPRDGRPVVWNVARSGARAESNACKQTASGTPQFPLAALDRNSMGTRIRRGSESGVVLALIEAQAEGAPSKIRILHDAGSARLADAVVDYLGETTMRCDRYPATVMQEFDFSIEGDSRYALKDMPLQNFLALMKDLDHQNVRFDFSTMGCPFDVQLKLLQPYLPNVVGQVGTADQNRADFIEWLRGIALDLPKDAARYLVGAQTRISVPCGTVDLTS